ncbi:MAG TPA: hypothetical protein VM661_09700 [Candidatus Sulfotelmatobacter sp.]|jgi:hypothetical protein|nr:hypothetical protein [Candidatus Sulfotelmatobacter sp.]
MCGGSGSGQCESFEDSIPQDGRHWAGYAFEDGVVPDDAAGVYVLAEAADGRMQALQIAEALNLAAAVALIPADLTARSGKLFWMRQDNPRLRSHIEKILVERYMAAPEPRMDGRQLWNIGQ